MEIIKGIPAKEIIETSVEISRNFVNALHDRFAAVFYGWNLDGTAVWRSSWSGNSLRGKVVGRNPFTGKITLGEPYPPYNRWDNRWTHQFPAREVHKK